MPNFPMLASPDASNAPAVEVSTARVSAKIEPRLAVCRYSASLTVAKTLPLEPLPSTLQVGGPTPSSAGATNGIEMPHAAAASST